MTFKEHKLPHDFFDWILLAFVIGTMTLTGYGQLRLIGVLMAGSYAFYSLLKKLWIPTEILILFAWVVWAGSTGYIVSIDKEAFFNTLKVVAQIMVMSIAISGMIAYRKNLNILFIGLLIGGIILVLSSLLSGEVFNALDPTAQLQVKGQTDNPNDYGYNLLICTTALLYLFGKSNSRTKQIVMILLLTIVAFAIILSASRKSFLGFIVLIFLWQFICFRKEILKRPYVIIFFIVITGSLFFVSSYMLSNTYMGTRFEREAEAGPAENRRVTLYEEGFEYIRENPMFGIGLGNFAVRSRLSKESHSDYIEVIASTGFVGALMYFSIYIFLWTRMNRLQKYIQNNDVIHNIGLFKALIITILLTATGRPNLTAQVTWIVLSGIIGYTWALEKEVLSCRIYKRANSYNG